MVIYNFDKVICVKFLLSAGYAESNTSLNTVFNQHRSTYYNSFCNNYNELTKDLPGDLMLPTKVYIPLPGSSTDVCRFEVQVPQTSFFFKKLSLISTYYDTSLYALKFDIIELFKLSVIKSSKLKLLYPRVLRKFFLTFAHSLVSFNDIAFKKVLFFIFIFPNIDNINFYNIKFNKDFKYMFFIN